MNQLPPEPWIETQATITSCRFQFARMNTFTLGIQTNKKYRITFDYYAHGQLYSAEFQSDRAIPQNDLIPLTYNPLDPHQNSRSHSPTAPTANPSLLTIGIIGSVILSLAWLAILRGCN